VSIASRLARRVRFYAAGRMPSNLVATAPLSAGSGRRTRGQGGESLGRAVTGEGGGGRAAGGGGTGEPLSWGIGVGGEQAGAAVGCGKEAGYWEKNARGLGFELPDFIAISGEQRGFLQNWQAGRGSERCSTRRP
jgi:hypothetical protein